MLPFLHDGKSASVPFRLDRDRHFVTDAVSWSCASPSFLTMIGQSRAVEPDLLVLMVRYTSSLASLIQFMQDKRAFLHVQTTIPKHAIEWEDCQRAANIVSSGFPKESEEAMVSFLTWEPRALSATGIEVPTVC